MPKARRRPGRELVKTARRLFFDDGYHPTSLEKVADAAGFSKGAVYSNFRNKDELCIGGARRGQGTSGSAEILDIMAKPDTLVSRSRRCGNGPNGSSAIRVGRRWRSSSPRMPAAMSSCAPIWPSRLTAILQMLTGAAESADGTEPPLPGGETATVMLALGVGLGLLRSIDPSIPVNGLVDILRLVSGQT